MNIQKVIRRKGFTIAQVAERLTNKRNNKIGMSQGSLSTILNNNPTIGTLKEIADIIGVSLSELVADEPTGSLGAAYPTTVDSGSSLSLDAAPQSAPCAMDLKAAIRKRGFTLTEVASQMTNKLSSSEGEKGISLQALNGIIKTNNPTIDTLSEIAAIIGCSVSELIGEEYVCKSGSTAVCPHCGQPVVVCLQAPQG